MELITMCLRVIGAGQYLDEKGVWPYSHLNFVNGEKILEFAKQHNEYNWIFKPHPRFKYAVICNNIMSKNEIENYENHKNWKKRDY